MTVDSPPHLRSSGAPSTHCGLPFRTRMRIEKCICGGMVPGRTVTVVASVDPGSDRFAINFRSPDGIAFHLNPRFKMGVVVLNNKTPSGFGEEEFINPNPIVEGKPFVVKIACTTVGYDVIIHGENFYTFKHRYTDFKTVEKLVIEEDINVMSVHID
ncbi:Galectin-9-like [Arapaima gigas]